MGIARLAVVEGFIIFLEVTSYHSFLVTLHKNKLLMMNTNLLKCPFSLKNEGKVVKKDK